MQERTRPQVKKAALLLDSMVPGWASRVDPETLKMSSCVNCVLGQVFGPRIENKLWEILPAKVKSVIRLTAHVTTLNSGYRKGSWYIRQGVRDWSDRISYMNTFSGDPALRCMWIEEIAERVSNPRSSGSQEPEGRVANSQSDPLRT